jgi:nucleoside-diphosphate kinase
MKEQTFMMIKPDGVRRKLVGDIISRIEKKGLIIVRLELLTIDEKLASLHYGEHIGKPFYDSLIEFITSGPVVAFVIEGDDVVEIIHKLAGKTNPKDAMYGTIRGDYAFNLTENVVHTSDSLESAKREINNFFTN